MKKELVLMTMDDKLAILMLNNSPSPLITVLALLDPPPRPAPIGIFLLIIISMP